MSERVRFRDLTQAREVLSSAELRFERARRTIGLFAGPALFVLLLALPLPGVTVPAARLAAVLAWVLTWWITEAVPIPIASILGPALAVVLGVGSAAEMFGPFGDPIVFLFLAFLYQLASTHSERGWPLSRTALVFVAALLPFGPFVIDRRLATEDVTE